MTDLTMTDPQWRWWLAAALPLVAVGLMLLWAAQLKRRGRFDGGVGRFHGLGRYFDSPRMRELALDFSALGSVTLVSSFTVLFALLFWLAGDDFGALLLALTSGLAGASGTTLKKLTRRVRPDAASATHFGSSFPSSHTLMGSTLYGCTAALLLADASPALASAGIASALLLSLLIGCSRVVLRVHYISDVMAGWWVAASLVGSVLLLR
ncbi:MAG: phosphatase PAP2 family protein [Pseudomonadota bacterium]